MRSQGRPRSSLTASTISRPPGTGNSTGQSAVKPHWTSTTKRHDSLRAITAHPPLRESWRLQSISFGEHHPPGGRLAGEDAFARLLGKLVRDTADGRLGFGGNAVLGCARAVP